MNSVPPDKTDGSSPSTPKDLKAQFIRAVWMTATGAACVAAGVLYLVLGDASWAPASITVAVVSAALAITVGLMSEQLLLKRLSATERAQRQSQQRLQDFTDAASDWLWEMDANLRFTYASQRFYELSGLTEVAVVGRDYASLGSEHLNARDWQNHLTDLQLRQPFRDFTHTQVHPDGQRRWLRLSGTPAFDETGQFEGYRGTGTDISGEVRAREEAVESTVRFLEAIENVSDGIAFWDSDDRFVLCNGRFREQAGRAAQLLVRGTHYEDYIRGVLDLGDLGIAEDEREAWVERRISEHRTPPNAVEVHREGRWLLIRDDRSPNGSIVSVATDITAVKQREQELQVIIDTVPMLLGYIDSTGCYQMINRTFEEWFEISREEIRGWKVVDVHGTELFNFVKPYMERALNGQEVRFEASIAFLGERLKSGYRGNRQIEITYTPDRAGIADGQVNGFFVAANDVTERMLATAQLHQSQKMEAIGQLTGGIAHDFNNLLAVIVGSLGLLEDRIEGERAKKLAAAALRSARRGGELTQRLLAFGRRQALMTEVTDANELVDSLIDLFRRTLGVGIKFETKLSDDLWLMDVDRGQLENALLNLAINARDAMPNGGRMSVETGNIVLDAAYTDQIDDLEPGAYVMIAVSDTGAGMTQEVRERAIEPFFSTKETGQGSGLGLSMIFGFTKQSGGHMRIYSEAGHGTSVRLYLPIGETSGPDLDRSTPKGEDFRSHGERILVLEDDPDVRLTTLTMLEELGYETIEAADAKAAIDLIDQGEPVDLLFSDVFLPGGMNGPDAAREILQRRPHLPILFTSGYSADHISQESMGDSDVHLISKPFDMPTLAQKLRERLDEAYGSATP